MTDAHTAPEQIETEWQFDADDLDRVRAWLEAQPEHAPLRFALRRDAEQVDSYHDTADWRLFFAGYSLRRRRRGESFEVTLKSLDHATDGLVSRREISEASEDGSLPAAAGPVSDRVRLIAGRVPLGRLFEVRTRRRSYTVDRGGRTIAHVELDETTIAPQTAPATTFRRVEVETTGGAPGPDLESFVQAMRYANHLVPTTTSKFEAGLGAAALDPNTSLDFGPTEHAPHAVEFAYARLREQWAGFLRHTPGTRLGEDIEALHQMRVATRRLRATIRVFDAVLPSVFQELRSELQWVGHELGAVRDLDVQIEGLQQLRAASSWEDAAALRPLIEVIEDERRGERRRLIELMDSDRFEALVARFSSTLRLGPPAGAAAPEVHVYASPILEGRFARVRKDGRKLRPKSPPAEYHALRIRAKRLRYSLEIFGELYAKPAERMTATLKTLQDMLGEHQDAEVGIERLRAIVARSGRDLPPETLVAIGALMERHRQRAVELRAEFARDFRAVLDRWRPLSRAIAAERPAPAAVPAAAAGKPRTAVVAGDEPRTTEPQPAVEQSPEDAAPAPPAPAPAAWAPPPSRSTSDVDGDGTLSRMRHLFHRD